jgi:hypothetical protein
MRGSAATAKNCATLHIEERNAARVRKVSVSAKLNRASAKLNRASAKLNRATTLFFFKESFTKMVMTVQFKTLNLFPIPVC